MNARTRTVPLLNRVAAFALFVAGLTCVGVATYLHRNGGDHGGVYLLAISGVALFVAYWKLRFGK